VQVNEICIVWKRIVMHNGVATVSESLNGALTQRRNRKLARYSK